MPGLLYYFKPFVEEVAIKAETSIRWLLTRLEEEANHCPLIGRGVFSTEMSIRSIQMLVWMLWDSISALMVQTTDEQAVSDRIAVWLYISAGGGKTATYVPID